MIALPRSKPCRPGLKLRPVLLVPVTDEARASLGPDPFARATRYPFRIGRESRSASRLARVLTNIERRLETIPPLNDLYLLEPSSSATVQISRKHCEIDLVESGFVLVDRGSVCGSVVVESRSAEPPASLAMTQVGGRSSTTRFHLEDGDMIIIGTFDSPYVFEFRVEAALPE